MSKDGVNESHTALKNLSDLYKQSTLFRSLHPPTNKLPKEI